MTAPLGPRAAYDRWAPTYQLSGRNPLTATAESALRSLVPPLAGCTVLDVGCGDGRYAQLAAEMGAGPVLGVDLSAGMLAAARQRGLATVCAADMRALPFPDAAVDVVLHVLALAHVPSPVAALTEAARTLQPGGILVLVDIHPDTARRGWQRTFRDGSGALHTVHWYALAIADIRAAALQAGLIVEQCDERPLALATLPAYAPPAARDGMALYALRARRAAAPL